MKVRKAVLEGRRIKPPLTSDADEAYLRLGIPDGVRIEQGHPRVCGVEQQVAGDAKVNLIAHNPLTKSGKKVMASMKGQYGAEKGERVFYASISKGKKGSKKWHK